MFSMKARTTDSTFLTFSPFEENIYGLFYLLRTNASSERVNVLSQQITRVFTLIKHLLQFLQLLPILAGLNWGCDDGAIECIVTVIPKPISTLLSNTFSSAFVASLIIFLVSIFLSIMLAYISVVARRRNVELGWMKTVFALLIALIVQTFYIDILYFVSNLLSCKQNGDIAISNSNHIFGEIGGDKCWSSLHSGAAILGLFASLILGVILLACSYLHDKYEIGRSMPGIHSHGRLEVFWSILRIFIVAQYFVSNESTVHIVFSVICGLACALLLFFQLFQCPFMVETENRSRAASLATLCGASFIGVIVFSGTQIDSLTTLGVLAIIGVIVWLHATRRANNISNLVRVEINNASSTSSDDYVKNLQILLMEEISDLTTQLDDKDHAFRAKFSAYKDSQGFNTLRQMLIFDSDVELTTRVLTKEWDSYSSPQKAVAKSTFYSLFLGFLQDQQETALTILVLANIARQYFNDLSTASALLKACFDRTKAFDIRYGCFCLQKAIDASRADIALGKKGGKNHLADLALFRKASQNARLHHEKALKILTRTFKLILADERQAARNARHEERDVHGELKRILKIMKTKEGVKEEGKKKSSSEKKKKKDKGSDSETSDTGGSDNSSSEDGKKREAKKSLEEQKKIKVQKVSNKKRHTKQKEGDNSKNKYRYDGKKDRISLLQSALDSITHAEANYMILATRFANNPDAIRMCRVFRQHFFKDETANATGTNDTNSSVSGGYGSSSGSSSELSSQSSITGERDSIKKQRIQEVISSLSTSFSRVRIGAFISLAAVAAMMGVTTVVIVQQLNFVAERINNLSYVERMFNEWPRACDAVSQIILVANELSVNLGNPKQYLSDFLVATTTNQSHPTTLPEMETACTDALTNLFAQETFGLLGCYLGLTTGDGVYSRIDIEGNITHESANIDGVSFLTDTRPLADWWYDTKKQVENGAITNTKLMDSASTDNSYGERRLVISGPFTSRYGVFYGIMAIEVRAVNQRTFFANFSEQLREKDAALMSSVSAILKQASDDGNDGVLRLFSDPVITINSVTPGGVVKPLNLSLQQANSLFSSSVDTLISVAASMDITTIQSHPSVTLIRNICMGTLFDRLMELVEKSISYVNSFIDSSIRNVGLVVAAAVLCLLGASIGSTMIVRRNLKEFDTDSSVSLAIRILLEMDGESKKALQRKFRNLKMPRRDDEELPTDIDETQNNPVSKRSIGANPTDDVNGLALVNTTLLPITGVAADAIVPVTELVLPILPNITNNDVDVSPPRVSARSSGERRSTKNRETSPSAAISSSQHHDDYINISSAKGNSKKGSVDGKSSREKDVHLEEEDSGEIDQFSTVTIRLSRGMDVNGSISQTPRLPSPAKISTDLSRFSDAEVQVGRSRVHSRAASPVREPKASKKAKAVVAPADTEIVAAESSSSSSQSSSSSSEESSSSSSRSSSSSNSSSDASGIEQFKNKLNQLDAVGKMALAGAKSPRLSKSTIRSSNGGPSPSANIHMSALLNTKRYLIEKRDQTSNHDSERSNSLDEEKQNKAPKQGFLKSIQKIVVGSISRWFVLVGFVIGLFLIITSVIAITRMDDFNQFQVNIYDVAVSQVDLSKAMLRVYDLPINNFITNSEIPTETLRNQYLDYIHNGDDKFQPILIKMNGKVSVMRSFPERENFVFNAVCIDPTIDCATLTYEDASIMSQGFYKAYIAWIQKAEWLYETYRSTNNPAYFVSVTNSTPATFWSVASGFEQITNGFSKLRNTFVDESFQLRDRYSDEQLIFCVASMALIVAMWLIIELVMKRERRRVNDVQLVLRIVPWQILLDQKVFKLYFTSQTDDMSDDDDNDEEDEDGNSDTAIVPSPLNKPK